MLKCSKKKTIWIGMFILFIGIQMISSQVTYTPTTRTECNKGICTTTIYSNTQYVFEDNKWKDFTEARSLFGKGFEIVTIKKDPDFPLEVIDFNATSIKVDLKKWSILNTDIPLKVLNIDNKILTETNERFNIFDLGSKERIIPFSIGNILKFGFNSTEIGLVAQNSENMDDSFISESSSNSNYGSQVYMGVRNWSGFETDSYLRFNISIIPQGNITTDAKLNLEVYTNDMTGAEYLNISIHHLYSTSNWTEETIKWNNKPDETFYNSTLSDSLIFNSSYPTDSWSYFDVTDIINSEIIKNNVSFYLRPQDANTVEEVRFYTKEYVLANRRPTLNITYIEEEYVDTTPPSVTIISPINDDYTNGTTINFNVTVSDESGIDNCYYTTDLGETNIGMFNDSTNWWNSSAFYSEALYTVRYYCNDTLGNMNDSETVLFGVYLTEPPTNSCTYTSGDWIINSSDYCNITSPIDINGNNLYILGNGTTTISANITNSSNILLNGLNGICTVKCINGGCIR